jgi:hypothetical protein
VPSTHPLSRLFGKPGELAERIHAHERYATWEREHCFRPTSSTAIAGIGFLYDLMGPAARARPFDPDGVAIMQRRLAVLGHHSG